MSFLLSENTVSLRLCALCVVALALQACASVAPRNAVPEELVEEASVSGGTIARMWGDALPPDADERVRVLKEQQLARDDYEDLRDRGHSALLISGGGANGAFGAGLLKGWSESGTRPEMTIVTGISTGALIAPYAFLGSEWDDELEQRTAVVVAEPVSPVVAHSSVLGFAAKGFDEPRVGQDA